MSGDAVDARETGPAAPTRMAPSPSEARWRRLEDTGGDADLRSPSSEGSRKPHMAYSLVTTPGSPLWTRVGCASVGLVGSVEVM